MDMELVREEQLREAACVNDLEALQKLIKHGVNVNSQNNVNGWTALHWAVKRGRTDAVRLLIQAGSDTSITNLSGQSPAQMTSNPNILHLLGVAENGPRVGSSPSSEAACSPASELGFTPSYLAYPTFTVDLTASRLQQDAPEASSVQQERHDPSSVQQERPESSSVQQERHEASSVQLETPEASIVQQDDSESSSIQQDSPDSNSIQQETPSASSAQQETSPSSIIQQQTPASSSVQQQTPASSSVQDVSSVQIAGTSSVSQDWPGRGSVQRTSGAISTSARDGDLWNGVYSAPETCSAVQNGQGDRAGSAGQTPVCCAEQRHYHHHCCCCCCCREHHTGGTRSTGPLLLLVRIADQEGDRDFIELELPPAARTLSRLLDVCCTELQVKPQCVWRVRKLPDVLVRSDADVARLTSGQRLELILHRSTAGQGHSSRGAFSTPLVY